MSASPHAVRKVNDTLTIGGVARLTGVTAKTIRYYEARGVVAAPVRADNGYRVYDEQAVHILRFIKRARALGFSLADVEDLLALWGNEGRSSADVKGLAQRHIQEIEQKLAELQGMRRTLLELVNRCHGDDRPSCPILDELAEADTHNSGS